MGSGKDAEKKDDKEAKEVFTADIPEIKESRIPHPKKYFRTTANRKTERMPWRLC